MRLNLALTFALLTAALPALADHPSFAGNWLLDTAQSTGTVPEWSGMQIGQNSRWVRMAQTDKNGHTVQTMEGECRTDGRFHPVEGAQSGSVSCKWDGSTLVTVEHWGANDANERTIRTMLQPDGTLVQEVTAGPNAGGSAHLVWKRK